MTFLPLALDLAVLDIAGTTVEEHQAVYAALRDAITAATTDPGAEEVGLWMGADKREAITALLQVSNPGEPEPALVEKTYSDFRDRLGAAYTAVPPTPLPGVAEAIAKLRAGGVKVVLTTGFTREVMTMVLDAVGWSDGFLDGVVCAEEVGAGRPAPYMVFEAMRRTGVRDVRRVLVAGDTVLDLEAGTNAGAGLVVGVTSGAMDAIALGRTRHTHLLGSVAEIPVLLR